MSNVLLQAKSITKSFAGVHALRNVSFELLAGEVHALVGENGAGKSTLTKIVTGSLAADSGTLEIARTTIAKNSTTLSHSLGVRAIYQQPAIFPHLTVAENIGIAIERDKQSWSVDWKARRKTARALMEQLGASIDPRRLANSLSMAEQQIVEIGKAIGSDAKIILMDEPTALLTDREAQNLFSLIEAVCSEGVGVMYISHRLEEIERVADRITVLRDGQSIATKPACDVGRAELIQMMIGRPVESIYPKRDVDLGDIALRVENLCNDDVGLHGVSFEIRKGEIFGLAGLVGSGRSELARTLFGLTPSTSEIIVNDTKLTVRSPAEAIEHKIAYLPEDRKQHGVIPEFSVANNISLADLASVSKFGWLNSKKEVALADDFIDALSIKTRSPHTTANNLSGGNQQKVALARWLAIEPEIIILDEPTQGVDVGSKAAIHELIVQLAERGMAILLISSELPEVLGMSDRVGVMREGTIAGILDSTAATQANVMALALGHTDSLMQAEMPC